MLRARRHAAPGKRFAAQSHRTTIAFGSNSDKETTVPQTEGRAKKQRIR
jgi:hypothetical protein